jgi:hypothetical protein
MTCLIWRQHRGQALWTVITVTALCALIVSFGLSAEHWLAGYHAWLRQLAAAGCPPPDAHSGVFHVRSAATCLALKDRYPGSLQAELIEVASGRPDLLAECAGLAAGFHQCDPDEAAHLQAAQLCIDAGADRQLIPRWAEIGRYRASARADASR